jgi:nucleoside-diphosphate-sugar epimerase
MVHTLLSLNDTLLKKKVKVIAVCRDRKRALDKFADYMKRKDFKLMIQDVCKPVAVKGPVHYIVHAASQASPKYYGSDPVGTILPNVIGTYNLLELARTKKSKGFIFFSSGEVYGELDNSQIPTKENDYGYVDPLNVRSCYAEGKRAGENMCVSWHHQYGVPAKIIRIYHTYGPGMRLDDGRVFADFVSNIVNKKDIIMKSDGSAKRAFCYISDAAIGMFLVLLKGRPAEAYNLGNDKCEVSILELAEIMTKLFPKMSLKVIKKSVQPAGYIRSRIKRSCPDISKICALGWEPNITIKEGFKRTIMSFLS